jgi:hypothetical protein
VVSFTQVFPPKPCKCLSPPNPSYIPRPSHSSITRTIVGGGPGSSVGIATDYGLDGPGIESRWSEIFRTRPDRPWGPPSLLYNGYRVYPGGKAAGAWCRPHHLLLAPSRPHRPVIGSTLPFTIVGEEYRWWSSSLWSFLHSPVTLSHLGPILCSTLHSQLTVCTVSIHLPRNVNFFITNYQMLCWYQ